MEYIEVNADELENITTFDQLDELNQADNFKFGKRFKKIAGGVLAVSTGGASLLATKKGRAKLKKAGRKIEKGLKKIGGFAAFAPLVPLIPVMTSALRKKGKPVPKGVQNISKAFFNEIVSKHSDFEEIHYDYDLDADNVVEAAVSGIIKGVLEFIKGLKKKKAEGGNLTPVESSIVTGTEQVEKGIKENTKDETAMEVGKRILFDRKTQLIIVAVIVIIIGVVWYYKKHK